MSVGKSKAICLDELGGKFQVTKNVYPTHTKKVQEWSNIKKELDEIKVLLSESSNRFNCETFDNFFFKREVPRSVFYDSILPDPVPAPSESEKSLSDDRANDGPPSFSKRLFRQNEIIATQLTHASASKEQYMNICNKLRGCIDQIMADIDETSCIEQLARLHDKTCSSYISPDSSRGHSPDTDLYQLSLPISTPPPSIPSDSSGSESYHLRHLASPSSALFCDSQDSTESEEDPDSESSHSSNDDNDFNHDLDLPILSISNNLPSSS